MVDVGGGWEARGAACEEGTEDWSIVEGMMHVCRQPCSLSI